MTDHAHPDAPLTRAEIREQIAFFNGEDRRLTQRLADVYRSGKGTSPEIEVGRAKARAAAEAMLNGNAPRILPRQVKIAGQSETDLYVLRDGVRLILDSLNQRDREAEEAEREARVIEMTPEWKAIIAEELALAVKVMKVEARARAYLRAAGDDIADRMPMSAMIGNAAFRSGWNHDLDDMIAAAKTYGIKV